jgi:hypothetical protein
LRRNTKMTVEAVQAAELRVLRSLRLVGILVCDSGNDMSGITNGLKDTTPPEIWEAREKAWTKVSELLRLTRGIITSIHDDSGPAFENAALLVERCETAIKDLEDERMLATSLRFTKRLEKESLRLRDQA